MHTFLVITFWNCVMLISKQVRSLHFILDTVYAKTFLVPLLFCG